ncbi:hypothetical protein RO3G_05611 [Rhizopus delemar RA 99-880]|uniref:Uncharacterized protein n=1 Tax=Rhizopus delemar (strain RA 99-880 / ATCC MYA-4621 / FGSC 9543 / NRRL 43880) TaxID=246409 RepID=I1BXH6_RHIO9|nr:hypothetical protein RO3G_05611 [Rhizopus delemar RA 99-880]|eukprot:EIE80906.1 hypothetical protein RO3G_05611 [Rhizopus delemar RA 99-880]
MYLEHSLSHTSFVNDNFWLPITSAEPKPIIRDNTQAIRTIVALKAALDTFGIKITLPFAVKISSSSNSSL